VAAPRQAWLLPVRRRRADGKRLVDRGFAPVPNTPGLGVEVAEEAVKAHLRPGSDYFAPTTERDKERSWDRLWS
jgi:L-alanine-DL-glutamate epimerase-like enolase superfamily enzyme